MDASQAEKNQSSRELPQGVASEGELQRTRKHTTRVSILQEFRSKDYGGWLSAAIWAPWLTILGTRGSRAMARRPKPQQTVKER